MIRPSTLARNIGRRYGRFTITAFVRKENKTQYFYECRCDCGTRKTLRLGALQQGATQSCGCYARELTIKLHTGNTYRRLSKGEAVFRWLFYRYKRDSAKRNIKFNLTLDEFRRLTKQNCRYCGAPPSTVLRGKHNYGAYTYSGVDRVDNDLGYTLENCVSCCTKCNTLKSAVPKKMILILYQLLFLREKDRTRLGAY